MTMTANETRNEFRKTLSAGTLIGDKVSNAQGDNLGHLKEIMLDVDSGHVAYGVLETGSFLGMGGKFLAIPWEAFSVDERNHKLVLNVPKETLENAEGFDKNNWPDIDLDYSRRMHDYYGFTPYWERT